MYFARLMLLISVLLFFFSASLHSEEVPNRSRKVNSKKDFKIPIAKESSFFVKPLQPNGGIDYLAALNAYRKPKGILASPEKNGAIYFVKAIGRQDYSFDSIDGPILIEAAVKKFTREQLIRTTGRDLLFHALGFKEDAQGLLATPQTKDPQFIEARVFEQIAVNRIQEAAADDDTGEEKSELLTKQFEFSYNTKLWKKEELPAVWRWIEKNKVPMGQVALGTKQPFFYLPYVRLPGRLQSNRLLLSSFAQSTYLGASRQIAFAFAGRAMNHLAEKRINKAIEDLKVLHRLARQIGKKCSPAELLHAAAIERIALIADEALAKSPDVSSVQLKQYRIWLKELPDVTNARESIQYYCRSQMLDFFQAESFGLPVRLGSSPKSKRKSFWNNFTSFDVYPRILALQSVRRIEWNIIAIEVNQKYDELYEINKQPYAKREESHERFYEKGSTFPQQYSLSGICYFADAYFRKTRDCTQLVKRYYFHHITPVMGMYFWAEEKVRMRRELVMVAIQLELYRRDHKKFPATLEALVPRYIKAIPKDRFTEEDLKYRSTGATCLLYSVGTDGRDNNGNTKVGQSIDMVIERTK